MAAGSVLGWLEDRPRLGVVMDKLGWAAAAVMIIAFWAFVIWLLVQLGLWIYVKLEHYGRCRLCGMPNEYPGHWPGCDLWRGENLDLLVFREVEEQNGREAE